MAAVVEAGVEEGVVVVVTWVVGVVVAVVVVAGDVVMAWEGTILRVISVTCNCFCSSRTLYRLGRPCSPGQEFRR